MPYLATIVPFGFADFDPVRLLPLYRELGCQRCQFYRNPENPPVLAEARRIVEDAGMPFDSIHGRFGPDLDPSSPDETVRRASVQTYRREGELALQLGAWGVVVHPAPAAPNTRISPQVRASRVGPLKQSLGELAAIGEELGVTWLIENLPSEMYIGNDPVQLADLVRELDHPRVRMCFDTGHANMTADAVTAARAARDVIAYLHIHDNDGRRDSHEVPGDGTIDWPALAATLASLPASTPAMLELFRSEEELRQRIDAGLRDQLTPWLGLDRS